MSYRSLMGLCIGAKRLANNLGGVPAIHKHPLYNTWILMISRCHDPRNGSYKHYGARGIRVCDSWREDLWTFAADMGSRPAGMTLERIDVNGNYEPSNCRWATKKEQQRNRRISRWISFRGERLHLTDWANRLGVKPDTLKARLLRGMPMEIALTTERVSNAGWFKEGGR